MKKLITLFFILVYSLYGQSQPVLYGVAKKPGTVKQIYMATVDPVSGYVNILSGPLATQHIGLGAGNTFDFERGLYYYKSPGHQLTEVNVYTGHTSRVITANLSGCDVASPQFACHDSSIYGFKFCSGSSTFGFGIFDLNSGTFLNSLTNFSTFPGEDYTYDKLNNHYLMINGNVLYSIDLNSFAADTFSIPLSPGERFFYPEYNCNDSCIYGIHSIPGNDLFLAKYNLNTNTFTTLSQTAFANGGILGGGRALDVTNGMYYYNVGQSIVSVRLSDGALIRSQPYIFSIPDPQTIYYIQISQTCYCERPLETGIENENPGARILRSGTGELQLYFENNKRMTFSLYDISSRLVHTEIFENSLTLNTSELSKGLYLYSIGDDHSISNGKILIGY
jgi:hypothetical protein